MKYSVIDPANEETLAHSLDTESDAATFAMRAAANERVPLAVHDNSGRLVCIVYQGRVLSEGRWTLPTTLPDPALDGRKFWLLSGKFERVGTYSAAEGGWVSEGILMDVTQYWSEPLPLRPGQKAPASPWVMRD